MSVTSNALEQLTYDLTEAEKQLMAKALTTDSLIDVRHLAGKAEGVRLALRLLAETVRNIGVTL